MAKAEKKYKARVANCGLYPVNWLVVWTVFSFAMIEIAIEDFGNEEGDLTLDGFMREISSGCVGLLCVLGVRKKKPEGAEA